MYVPIGTFSLPIYYIRPICEWYFLTNKTITVQDYELPYNSFGTCMLKEGGNKEKENLSNEMTES